MRNIGEKPAAKPVGLDGGLARGDKIKLGPALVGNIADNRKRAGRLPPHGR